jgi:hypothetical protein
LRTYELASVQPTVFHVAEVAVPEPVPIVVNVVPLGAAEIVIVSVDTHPFDVHRTVTVPRTAAVAAGDVIVLMLQTPAADELDAASAMNAAAKTAAQRKRFMKGNPLEFVPAWFSQGVQNRERAFLPVRGL